MNITLESVTKRFGSITAVDSVSLAIEDSELFFLVGPSGCGKNYSPAHNRRLLRTRSGPGVL